MTLHFFDTFFWSRDILPCQEINKMNEAIMAKKILLISMLALAALGQLHAANIYRCFVKHRAKVNGDRSDYRSAPR
jgi:hypothetical protein